MSDLLSDRARILLILDRERAGEANEAIVQACESCLRALDMDKRGYGAQFITESLGDDKHESDARGIMADYYREKGRIKMTHKEILALRQKLELTQAEFCDLIGVSLTTLWRLEKGHEKPSKTLVKLLETIINK